MRILIALVAWVGAIAASVAVSTAVANSIHSSSTTTATGSALTSSPEGDTSTSIAPAVVPAAPLFDPSSVKPTDSDSLFVGRNFSRVVAVARLHLGAHADVVSARISPGDLELVTIGKNNEQRAAVIDANGSYTTTSAGQFNGSIQVYYLSQLSASTPATLAKRIATRAHVPIARLQYMLVTTDPAQHQFFWRVYPTNSSGIYFKAGYATGPIQELGGTRTIVFR
jgi:hypothetical protein